MSTINNSQAIELKFKKNFVLALQQQKSLLRGSGVVEEEVDFGGFSTNYPIVDALGDFTEITARQQANAFSEAVIKNRHGYTKTFYKTLPIDKSMDVEQLIADPTSAFMASLVALYNRWADRQIVAAALGSVVQGAPDEAGTTLTAAQDGVVTIDGSAGMAKPVINEIVTNAINANIPDEEIHRSVLCVTGQENADLSDVPNLVNKLYTLEEDRNKTIVYGIDGMAIKHFAGSRTGAATVANPVLPEATANGQAASEANPLTTRTCVWLAPRAVYGHVRIKEVVHTPDVQALANTQSIKIVVEQRLFRTMGQRVQAITTDI